MKVRVFCAFLLLCLVVSAQDKNVLGRFQVKNRSYGLSQTEAGILHDVRNTRDGGERDFNFNSNILTRHYFASQRQSFSSLGLEDRIEIRSIATGAVEFLEREKKVRVLSKIEQEHEKILNKFLSSK